MNHGFVPEEMPVVETGADLAPVPLQRLTAQGLRERFRTPPAWEPERIGDVGFGTREQTGAAVLIPLVTREALTVLLTRRTSHLKAHAGQISFPGGRVESEDPDAVATALRETQEEVGLAPQQIEVLGHLPTYTTVTGFVVTPIVGLVAPPLALTPDPFEVDETFEVPLNFLMTPAHHRRHAMTAGGGRHDFLSMPWRGLGHAGEERDYFIWGATAAMLRNLYRFLAA
jgi:8-oxo-dGTP pyrophosphatase MutT (NUDIX family)